MLDSGAGIPVWCTGMDTLIDTFPNAILRQDLKGILSGFGSQFEVVDVFYIPKVEICNGEMSIIFSDFYLPMINRLHFDADLIIPSSMFKNSNIILSQLELLDNKKKLVIQYQTGYYKTQYTVRYLSVEGISNINKICKKQNLTIDTRIIGGEDEFNRILIQDDSNLIIEKSEAIEDSNTKDSKISAHTTDVFLKNQK